MKKIVLNDSSKDIPVSTYDGSVDEGFIDGLIQKNGLKKPIIPEFVSSFIWNEELILFSQLPEKMEGSHFYSKKEDVEKVREWLDANIVAVYITAPIFNVNWEKIGEKEQLVEYYQINDSIVNLTQHPATAEQVAAGVVEPSDKGAVQSALTFESIPTALEMSTRAQVLANIALDAGCTKAMIGGAPFFMSTLEKALKDNGITPVYAFSIRDSREEDDGNGGVRKINIFKHVGFIEV